MFYTVPVSTFAGSICIGPLNEQGEFVYLAIIFAALSIVQWIILTAFRLLFKKRRTFHTYRRTALQFIYRLQIVTVILLLLGYIFGNTDMVSPCTEIINSPFGYILEMLAITSFALSLLASVVFIFLFKREKTPKT